MWAIWIRNTVLKDKFFWQIPVPTDCSWIWRKVLQLRIIARPHIAYKIGNGSSISLWFDPWSLGLPFASTHDPIIIHSGLGMKATLKDIIVDSRWSLPASNSRVVARWRDHFDYSRTFNSYAQDSILWNNSFFRKLKASHIWKSIRQTAAKVNWHKLVWHKMNVPRFSFFSWLAMHRKLNTADVLINYGMQVNAICHLCNQLHETFDHLLFDCTYSAAVLSKVFAYGGWYNFPTVLSSITHMISNLPGLKVIKLIQSLCLNATIYKLWQERNSRFHSQGSIPSDILSNEILKLVQCRLSSSTYFCRLASLHSCLLPWKL